MKPYRLLLHTFSGILGCYAGAFLGEFFHDKYDAHRAFITATEVVFVYMIVMLLWFLFTRKK